MWPAASCRRRRRRCRRRPRARRAAREPARPGEEHARPGARTKSASTSAGVPHCVCSTPLTRRHGQAVVDLARPVLVGPRQEHAATSTAPARSVRVPSPTQSRRRSRGHEGSRRFMVPVSPIRRVGETRGALSARRRRREAGGGQRGASSPRRKVPMEGHMSEGWRRRMRRTCWHRHRVALAGVARRRLRPPGSSGREHLGQDRRGQGRGGQGPDHDDQDRHPGVHRLEQHAPADASQATLGGFVDPWPTNPFTNAPMQQGDGVGDYVYTPGSGTPSRSPSTSRTGARTPRREDAAGARCSPSRTLRPPRHLLV